MTSFAEHPVSFRASMAGLCLGVALTITTNAFAEDGYRMEATIQVTGLGPKATLVPVSCEVDFRRLLESARTAGVVDEQSIQMFRDAGGQRIEVPVQFEPSSQPRAPRRQLARGTSTNVSYAAEYMVQDAPPQSTPGGELT